ncbi:hypothetical protein PghCCS26_47370 [Paenibacillus glycanilyticus]|uniref:Uncharacterized protein n=1 Tax=Paenibacillus glycanilyticus TaxID=126569 RepID=A0ABQ6NR76_9BACL|nr:hypothetical protein [Paenibacillus glycanilyticus]GMK47607.1 hypothetical protein PghCCS26_47370 [Paenibacillus glycanilyticus]
MAKLNVVIPETNVIVEGVEYRKVERAAQTGDIVRITDEDAHDFSYLTHNGYYAILEIDSAGDPQITDDDGDDFDLGGWKYEVYEKATEETQTAEDDSVITYGGVMYRKVNRNANAGDTVIVTSWESHRHLSFNPTRVGDVFKSVKVDCDFDVHVGEYVIYRSEYNVLEPVETQSARLKVGEYAKVIEATAGFSKVGQIVKITDDDRTFAPFNTEALDGEYTGWHYENGLIRATDEEVAAAKAAFEPKFNEGDTVKLVSLAGGILHGFNVGDIVTVVYNPHGKDDFHYRIKNSEGHTGYASKNGGLAPLTTEEIAQEALTAKWAAIGRKVNEFKTGDIVQVDNACGAPLKSGDWVEVKRPSQNTSSVAVTERGWLVSVKKLVTPVEQRFDRVG